MEQPTVAFSATILSPIGMPPVDVKPEELPDELAEAKDTVFEPMFAPPLPPPLPPPLTRQCCVKKELEHPHERFERHSELADALPSIFVAFGVAYALGVLTGGMIFSSPSMAL
jgi:hypothetical protein